MVRRNRPHARTMVVGVVMAVGTAIMALSGSSSADVTAVRGSAYGVFSSISLFGGPPGIRGPMPTVTLPPGGSAVPLTASVPNLLVPVGPAIIFSSGPATVSTQGTIGPGGSVTSSSDIMNVNSSGQEVFTASRVRSSCTASEAGVTGTTTITGGTLRTSEGNPDIEGDETVVAIPMNPAPNTTFTGTIEAVGDNFRYVFNEQITNPDGSITVNAAHLYALGATAVGNVIIGQSVCGVTATAPPPTTTAPPPTTTSTSTTIPPTTTSTSTTIRPTTTTTSVGTCGGLTPTIVGTSGNDSIVGTQGPDVIVGSGGYDRIQGLAGDDVICGGDGNDQILGGDGNDRVFGDAGNDQLFGEAGNDILAGGTGQDRLVGGDGNDALSGDAEADQCLGDAGTDTASTCESTYGVP